MISRIAAVLLEATMRTVICAALLCSLTAAFSVAQEQPKSQDKQFDRDQAVYEEARRLGKDLFLEMYKEDGAVVRTVAILRACERDGLAKAVEAKQKDPEFINGLAKMISEGRFNDLPSYALGSVHSIAEGIRVGYQIGYREAAKLGQNDTQFKPNLCAAALKAADEILKR